MSKSNEHRVQSQQAGCFFYVSIGNDTKGVFTEVSGLQAEVEIFKYREGGINNQIHMLPGAITVSNITLKRGIVNGNEFYLWFKEILGGNIKRQNITVRMHGPGGIAGNDPLYSWSLLNAFPCKWSTTNLSADATTLVIESLELAHEGFGDTTL
jgi:phage tail-like protein